MFSTVVRASGSTTTSRAAPRHAARISSASGVRARHTRPAGEDDDVLSRGDLRRPCEPRRADGMELAAAAVRVAEHDDDAGSHARRWRSQRKKSSVPTTVSTSFTAFLPCSFDSPVRALAHVDRDLLDAEAGLASAAAAPRTSGAPLTYGCAMIGIAFALTAAIPLVGSRNGRPSRTCIAFWRSADPEPPRPRSARSGRPRSPLPPRSASRRRRRSVRADEVEQPARARPRGAGRPRRPARRSA